MASFLARPGLAGVQVICVLSLGDQGVTRGSRHREWKWNGRERASALKTLERAKGIEPSTLSLGIRKKPKRIMIDFHYSRCVHTLECHRVGGEWK